MSKPLIYIGCQWHLFWDPTGARAAGILPLHLGRTSLHFGRVATRVRPIHAHPHSERWATCLSNCKKWCPDELDIGLIQSRIDEGYFQNLGEAEYSIF